MYNDIHILVAAYEELTIRLPILDTGPLDVRAYPHWTRRSVVDTDEPLQTELSTETLFKARLDYVMRNFINTQDLIRFMDQKAGYLLSAVGLLTTALGIVAAKALDANANLTWHLELSAPELITVLKVLALISFVAIYCWRSLCFRAPPKFSRRSPIH